MSILIRVIIASLFLASCALAPPHNGVTADYVRANPPAYPVKDYIIQPGDQLDVKFFYNPELNESVAVRPDGRISLQLAPEVTAAGLTPAQLTGSLDKIYAKDLANPGVTVIVRTFNSQKVYVEGEVGKTGMINLAGRMTVLQAISEAGGFKYTSSVSQVIVLRKGDGNKPVVIALNMEKVRNGEDTSQDIELAPYDIVYVPKSAIANIDDFVDLYMRRMIPIPFGLTYQFP